MSRYFFHVHDGRSSRDDEGTELPNIRAARLQALRLTGELLKDDDGSFWDGDEWRMEVTDYTGLLLFTLDFVATEAPSVQGSRTTNDKAGG